MGLKRKAVVLMGATAIATVVVGCGYELRRNATDTSVSASHHTNQIRLSVADTTADALMREQLQLMGYHIIATNTQAVAPDAHTAPVINVSNLSIQRYELLGALTEIRLILTADVSYQIGSDKHHHILQATRSYQHNKAGVSSSDTEYEQVKLWLYQELARKIGEQHRILLHKTNRTPSGADSIFANLS